MRLSWSRLASRPFGGWWQQALGLDRAEAAALERFLAGYPAPRVIVVRDHRRGREDAYLVARGRRRDFAAWLQRDEMVRLDRRLPDLWEVRSG